MWGAEAAAELIPLAHKSAAGAITGLVERPHAATAGGRRSYLFVNGRSFTDRHLVRAVDRGYHTTIPPGVRPSFFLFLDVADGEVDVNVHPAKAEVRFRNHIGIEEGIEAAVRAALRPLESTPALGTRSEGSAESGSPPDPRRGVNGEERPAASGPDSAIPADQMSLFISGASDRDDSDDGLGEAAGDDLPAPTMWQVHNTYIFAETRDGLVIVDQHAAHERILYEELMTEWDRPKARVGQRLLFPLTIRLTPAELSIVEQLQSLFTRVGYEIEEFGGRAIIVHAVPNPHPYFDSERCLRDMIRELTEGSELVNAARNQHQRLALSFACKGAIKAGQPLDDREIAELFDRLFATELPFHDIHGRPTVVQLSLTELHNRFRRSG